MPRLSNELGTRRRPSLYAKGFVVIAVPLLFALLDAAPTQAQAQAQTAAAVPIVFEYEVASIKPNKSTSGNVNSTSTPDSFTITNAPLATLIQVAYGVQANHISGASGWIAAEHYDIDAKVDPAVADAFQKLSLDDRRLTRQKMLQALLADRFKLVVHRETRELPIYSLVFAKDGPKLQETKPDPNAPVLPGPAASRGGPSIRTSSYSSGPVTMTALHTSTSDLATSLSTNVGRIVLDKTGLTARYDFVLKWTADDAPLPTPSGNSPNASPSTLVAPDPSAPSLFTAIQEQLGLKLEPGKGPVEIIVIDHAERPSEN